MKSRFWIAAAVLSCVILAYVLWPRPRTEAGPQLHEQALKPTKAPPTSPAGLISNRTAAAATAPSTPSGSGLTPQGEIQRQDAVIKQALEHLNVPIDFYGRVIDQDSNTLSTVKIDAWVRHWDPAAPGASLHIEKATDAQGRFDIHGVTGDGFELESMQKPGYELEPGQRGYGTVGGSRENPVVFKMWAANVHEQLITGEKSFDIVPDGRPYVIDLTKGTISESGGGDLKVWVKYATQVTRGQTYALVE